MADVTTGALDALREGMTGTVAKPGEAGYDEAVNIWNGAITRRPAVVASCTSERRRAPRLRVRPASTGSRSRSAAAGTTTPASRSTDGGLMIDLTPMKAVTRRPRRHAGRRCGGGTTWGELDAATQEHGAGGAGRLRQPHRRRRAHARRRPRLAVPPGRAVVATTSSAPRS